MARSKESYQMKLEQREPSCWRTITIQETTSTFKDYSLLYIELLSAMITRSSHDLPRSRVCHFMYAATYPCI